MQGRGPQHNTVYITAVLCELVLKSTIWDTEVQLSEKPAVFTVCTLYQAAGKGSVLKIISKTLNFWNLCRSSWIIYIFFFFSISWLWLSSCCPVPHVFFCEPGWPCIHLLLFDGVLPPLVSKRQLIPIQSICWGVWHAAGVLVVKAGAGFLLFAGTQTGKNSPPSILKTAADWQWRSQTHSLYSPFFNLANFIPA